MSERVRPPVQEPLKEPMPGRLEPMLFREVHPSREHPGWLLERKWDGYRALAFIQGSDVKLSSSQGKSHFNHDFPRIVEDLHDLGGKVILDGEIVLLDEAGHEQFDLHRFAPRNRPAGIVEKFLVFDLLYLDGFNLMRMPLKERKRDLAEVFSTIKLPHVEVVDFRDDIALGDFMDLMKDLDAEGAVNKNPESPYVPGPRHRTDHWLKIKLKKYKGWSHATDQSL